MTQPRNKSLPLDWTKNLQSEDEKKEFEELLLRSSVLTRRIKEVLALRLEALENVELSAKAYETAAWAYKQADINGARRELRYLVSLFDFIKDQ